HLTGAPVPEPVPIVVQDVVAERLARGGPLPELIVEMGGGGTAFADADRVTGVGVPAAGVVDGTDVAAAYALDPLGDLRPRAALVAHLDYARVAAGGFDDQLALARVVARRLLYVDVFAGLHGQHGGGGVPVVRRGDDHRVHVGALEGAAEIGDGPWPLPEGRDLAHNLRGALRVGIADEDHLRDVEAGKALGERGAASSRAHDRHADTLGRRHATEGARCGGSRQGGREAGANGPTGQRLHEGPSGGVLGSDHRSNPGWGGQRRGVRIEGRIIV